MPKGSGKPIPKVAINLEISPEEGEELLEKLKRRFEKTWLATKAWNGLKYRQSSRPNPVNCLH